MEKLSTIVKSYMATLEYPLTVHAAKYETVYLVFNFHNALCKIGITTNIEKRIREINIDSGGGCLALLIIYLEQGYDEPSKSIESFLHDYFKGSRIIGEWFKLSLRDVLSVRDLFWAIEGENIDDHIRFWFEQYKNKGFVIGGYN